MEPLDDFLTTQEVAQQLRVHKTTIYKWVKEGRLRAYKISYGILRIHPDDLAKFIATGLREGVDSKLTVQGMHTLTEMVER